MINKTAKPVQVLGIGNALVDVITVLDDDSLLAVFGLQRGSMTLVSEELSRRIYTATETNPRQTTTGGSAANTIHSLAALGISCGFLGKVGNDELGKVFREELEQKSIKSHLLISEKDTGKVVSLVSADSERTMATCLGAAADLKPEELTDAMFEGYSLLYIEGYLVQDHRLIETAIDIARNNKLKIAIDLSSFNVVEQNQTFLRNLVAEKVDLVFANEEEAFAFTGKKQEVALEEIASMCELAVVKAGKGGSFIQRGTEKVQVGIIDAHAVDTTGAGDNYAAGFLYGYTKGYSLKRCGQIAALVSGKAVEVMGAKIKDEQWPQIRQKIENIEC